MAMAILHRSGVSAVKRIVGRLSLALGILVLPAGLTFLCKGHPDLNPLVSLSFLLAIAVAGSVAGLPGGLLACAATTPILVVITTNGRMILPERIDYAANVALILIAWMSSRLAAWRRRADEIQRMASLELESKVKQRTRELEAATTRLTITLRSIGDAVITTDGAGSIELMNGPAAQLTGWSQTEAEGRPIDEVCVIVTEASRQPAQNLLSNLLSTSGALEGLGDDTVLVARGGHEVAIEARAAPIRDSDDRIAGIVLTLRDVTERRNTERKAAMARQHLEETNRELRAFAFAASHDLREPLRTVSLYTELLTRKAKDRLDAEAHEFVSFIINGARRMDMLLNGLLMYTTVAERDESGPSAANADKVVESVLMALDGPIRQCAARVTVERLPEVAMNAVHLEQVFQNLISNSIKYRSTQPLAIHIRAVREDGSWMFRVEDNGIGIHPRHHERIFGLFKRLHTSEECEGTGLGLAICQKIVQRYGGRIWVESQADQGSSFCFTVPGVASKALSARR
jgi:PAS domain S-box-containing protein